MTARDEAIDAFLKKEGWADATRTPLPGDASTRRYIKLTRGSERAMLMDQPQGAETPTAPANATAEERAALGYNAIVRLAGADCSRFVAAANYLSGLGLSAPQILAAAPADGLLLIEDLGDALYADVITEGGDARALYEAAADALARIHSQDAPTSLSPKLPLFVYDETALVAETDLLTQWFFPYALKREATKDEVTEHRGLWRELLKPLAQSRPVFVHRDYHAQNLLWLPERNGAGRVGLIDFQDAVAGNTAYDLVSLVEDARRDVEPAVAAATIARYKIALREAGRPVNEEEFARDMALLAAQRNAKIVGIFARLFARDGKPRYLSYLPRVWRYLDGDLTHPVMAPLQTFYDRTISADLRRKDTP